MSIQASFDRIKECAKKIEELHREGNSSQEGIVLAQKEVIDWVQAQLGEVEGRTVTVFMSGNIVCAEFHVGTYGDHHRVEYNYECRYTSEEDLVSWVSSVVEDQKCLNRMR